MARRKANAPKILVSTTPSTPALPGQTVLATVRAEGYSPIASLAVQVRGAGIGTDAWQSLALDGAGRLRLIPTQPGLIEIQVSATDRDGFSATTTQSVRVKDPTDAQAPAIAWRGALQGAAGPLNGSNGPAPVQIATPTPLSVALREQQLMGYELEIAPAGSNDWEQRGQACITAFLNPFNHSPTAGSRAAIASSAARPWLNDGVRPA